MRKRPFLSSLWNRIGRPLAAGFLLLAALNAPAQAHEEPPVVVELFTSQGCSSCPPADALMSELSRRADLITLTLPIDYWDKLGWPDTFASPRHSARQRAYARQLGTHRVYTPQMVINGQLDVVGSHKDDVLKAIDQAKATARPTINIALSRRGDDLTIVLDDAPPELDGVTAWIWIVPYHAGIRTVDVTKGENRGRTLSYANVVDGIMKIGDYRGRKVAILHSLAEMRQRQIDDCVILVQQDGTGAILAAKRLTSG